MRIINAPSLANCNFLTMGAQVAELVQGGADWFHVDIMDGHYVPNLCFPVRLVAELKATYPRIPVDAHLMVDDPTAYLEPLVKSGADYISFHLDATSFSRRLLHTIRQSGKKAGVAINPSQPVDLLAPLLEFVDYVVLMTVEPGFAGQRFLPDSIGRLEQLCRLRAACGNPFLISIDGGVDKESAATCTRLGAEIFVTGIYTVFNQDEPVPQACVNFRNLLEAAAREKED